MAAWGPRRTVRGIGKTGNASSRSGNRTVVSDVIRAAASEESGDRGASIRGEKKPYGGGQ